MSAPTALESGALERGIAWRTEARATASLPTGADRRRHDPLSLLGREHDTLCRSAADPDEIAAVLEAAGVDDRSARSRYAMAGTFQVAEALWTAVPWRAARDDPGRELWRLPLWRALLRGLVYVLPPLLAALALGGVATGAVAPLLLATALTISLGQGLSVLGHLSIGRGQRHHLAGLTTIALSGAIVVGGLGVAATAVLGGPLTLVSVCAGQLLFVLAATLLIVQERDLLLVALIAPGALAAVAAIAAGPTGRTTHLVHVGAALGTVLVTALAAAVTGPRTSRAPFRLLAGSIGRTELGLAGAASLHGLGLTALAAGPIAVVSAGRTTLAPADVVLASLPLTTTLGTAEYFLHRARRRSLDVMVRARTLNTFRHSSAAELRVMVGLQTLAAAVVAAAVLLLDPNGGTLPLQLVTATYVVLGTALLLATTLMSLGHTTLAARWSSVGGATLVGVGLLAPLRGADLAAVQLGVVVLLLAVAHRLTAPRFAETSAHR